VQSGDGQMEEQAGRSSSEHIADRTWKQSDAFLRQQIEEKDRQIGKLHTQLERRDEQIMSMLERDRETNILIKGLQEALLPGRGRMTNRARAGCPVRSFDRGDSDNERDQSRRCIMQRI
jgi:hypothetical protein